MHTAATEEDANEKHRALSSHKEALAQFNELLKKNEDKRAAFEHGKDHND
jgi:hypothetical protein